MMIPITIDNPRLGDTIYPEPALTALSKQTGRQINLYVQPQYRCLFHNHPHIRISETKHDCDSIHISAARAFDLAHKKKINFCAAYFDQVGANFDNRLHFQVYGLKPKVQDVLVIAPFSRSCSSMTGKHPNIIAQPNFWQDIILATTLPIVSLGDRSDPNIIGTINIRHETIYQAMQRVVGATLFISIETGLLAFASMRQKGTIFLSSATPEFLCKPLNSEVVRSSTPIPSYDHKDVIEKMNRLIGGR